MASSSPLPSLSSFDPALHLHSEPNDQVLLRSHDHSDDLEAWRLQCHDAVVRKTQAGVVIQHRAWKLAEAFRSDEDHNLATPSKSRILASFPSSPPQAKMMLSSSPVAYPPSSSPPIPQKRKHFEHPQISGAKKARLTGFLVDEEDEDNGNEDRYVPALNYQAELEVNKENIGNDIASDRIPCRQLPLIDLDVPSCWHRQDSRGDQDVRAVYPGRKILRTCSGNTYHIQPRSPSTLRTYERIVAERSTAAPGRAQKSYYGVDIHRLLDEARKDIKTEEARRAKASQDKPLLPTKMQRPSEFMKKNTGMWTEKYRARKFIDLVGDERTHRTVMRWLKSWDSIVFPGLAQSRPKKRASEEDPGERSHRKILLLTGPPGLGKTTLAHVCARQAGYEVLEINASDERSRDVVKGRIRDAVGTENVRGVNVETSKGTTRKAGKPVCIVVDEVDGVVSGSGGSGEGGFIKALIDLVLLDQKNATKVLNDSANTLRTKKKGDSFRILRPLILICNDVYHPSLRPLRASTIAEIIHIRKPPLDKVVQRMKAVFEKESIPSDLDAIRRLCESTWGLGGRKEGRAGSRGSGEGDIRGVLVAGEWMAHKIRSSSSNLPRLTRKWVDLHLQGDASQLDPSARGLCRGGVREIVERVFLDGAGFSNPLGSATPPADHLQRSPEPISELKPSDLRKRRAISQLREMIDTTGDHDRCITECFSQYPSQTYQDDNFLSKPNRAYEWLQFHDLLSSKVFSGQEWELTPYLSQSVLVFHDLFAAVGKHSWDSERTLFEKDVNGVEGEGEPAHPFSGPRADFAAFEAEKAHRATLLSFQSSLPAPLLRSFRSADAIAMEMLPPLMRMLAPEVKPVVVGGSGENRGIASVRKESEKLLVKYAAKVMAGLGITFERARIEGESGAYGSTGWIFRMEPPLDALVDLATSNAHTSGAAPVRYAVRQVLDQEYHAEILRARASAREARYHSSNPSVHGDKAANKEDDPMCPSEYSNPVPTLSQVKRDFFGRVIVESSAAPLIDRRPVSSGGTGTKGDNDERKIWVHYHEGFSNAVRKPITLLELMAGL